MNTDELLALMNRRRKAEGRPQLTPVQVAMVEEQIALRPNLEGLLPQDRKIAIADYARELANLHA